MTTETTADPIAAYEAARTLLTELEAEQASLPKRSKAAALAGDGKTFNALIMRREQLPHLIEAARREVVRTEVAALDARIAAHEATREPLRRREEAARAALAVAQAEHAAAVDALRAHHALRTELQEPRKHAWRRLVNQAASETPHEGHDEPAA